VKVLILALRAAADPGRPIRAEDGTAAPARLELLVLGGSRCG
jgi:hypothetical protein